MSKSNLALVAFVAVAAAVGGVAYRYAGLTPEVDSSVLTQAQLVQYDANQNESSVRISAVSKDLTLVNFWATWCAPCREEMPLFQAFVDRYSDQGFEVVGIAIDSPENARSFLDAMGITYPILYAEATGMRLMAELNNPQGLLPFSILLDQHGTALESRLGLIHEHDISAWISKYLPKSQG